MLVDAQPPSAISYLLPPALRISINPFSVGHQRVKADFNGNLRTILALSVEISTDSHGSCFRGGEESGSVSGVFISHC